MWTVRLGLETWRLRELNNRGWVMTAFGGSIGGLSIAAAAGWLPAYSPTIFLLATMWTLAVTAISFIALVVAPRKN